MNLKGAGPERFGRIRSWFYHRWFEPAVDPFYGEVASALPGAERILDLGCGTGRLAERLAETRPGVRVVGADVEPAMLRYAVPRGARPRGARFVLVPDGALPFGDGAFDLVVSTLSLHHWEEPGETLAEVRRVLVPGGRFIAIDANPGAPDGEIRRLTAGWKVLRPPPRLLRRGFRRHGFGSVEIEETVGPALRDAGFDPVSWRPFLWCMWIEGVAGPLPAGEIGEPFRIPLEDALDLHTFRPAETAAAAAAYLDEAWEAGFREVRLIHGRGIGVQREIVRKLCARHPAVESFGDAPPGRGGWGATIVRLRPR